MPDVICSTVGTLVGDSWMLLPGVVNLCRSHSVELVSGSYSLPVWKWAQKHVVGADYTITQIFNDPDDIRAEFCPGFGFQSIDRAVRKIKKAMPHATVLGPNELPSAYHPNSNPSLLELLPGCGTTVYDGSDVVIHPYTRHEWKNCNLVVGEVTYSRPVKIVGIPGEFVAPYSSWGTYVLGFDAMVSAVLSSAGFVGVLSSFTNLAVLFQKKQIIVSFSDDIPLSNPRAVKLIRPDVQTLQVECERMGL